MIKLIVFDMDGVLVDAKSWHFEALNEALKYYSFPIIELDVHLKEFDGLPTKDKLNKYEKIYNVSLNNLKEEINTKKQELTVDIALQKLCKDDEKIQLMSWIKNNGFSLACCSNSIYKTIELFLKKLGIFDFFDVILSNNDVTFPKPHPEIYEKVICRFKVDPKEVIVFEDNHNGIEAARKSGANVIVVKNAREVNLSFLKSNLNGFSKKY